MFTSDWYDHLIVKVQFFASFLVEFMGKVKLRPKCRSLNNDGPSPYKKNQVQRHVSSHVSQKRNKLGG